MRAADLQPPQGGWRRGLLSSLEVWPGAAQGLSSYHHPCRRCTRPFHPKGGLGQAGLQTECQCRYLFCNGPEPPELCVYPENGVPVTVRSDGSRPTLRHEAVCPCRVAADGQGKGGASDPGAVGMQRLLTLAASVVGRAQLKFSCSLDAPMESCKGSATVR